MKPRWINTDASWSRFSKPSSRDIKRGRRKNAEAGEVNSPRKAESEPGQIANYSRITATYTSPLAFAKTPLAYLFYHHLNVNLPALLPSLFCCERVKLTKHFGDFGI